jgi:hypothetical protein
MSPLTNIASCPSFLSVFSASLLRARRNCFCALACTLPEESSSRGECAFVRLLQDYALRVFAARRTRCPPLRVARSFTGVGRIRHLKHIRESLGASAYFVEVAFGAGGDWVDGMACERGVVIERYLGLILSYSVRLNSSNLTSETHFGSSMCLEMAAVIETSWGDSASGALVMPRVLAQPGEAQAAGLRFHMALGSCVARGAGPGGRSLRLLPCALWPWSDPIGEADRQDNTFSRSGS